jgi:hypothetical protein
MAFFGIKGVGDDRHHIAELAQFVLFCDLVKLFDNDGAVIFGAEQVGLVPGTFCLVYSDDYKLVVTYLGTKSVWNLQ